MLKTYPCARECVDTLLPVGFACADVGLAGAMTSLASITQSLKANPQHWARRARQWGRVTMTGPVHRTLYEHALHEGAGLLFETWKASRAVRGWMVVEIEPSEIYSAASMLRRARELANLMPNIMVSVPLSEEGCEVIEELVASGHAINASLCFSVAQVQAGLAAINRGRQRAMIQGVNLERTRHLISVLPAGVMEHPEFVAQAAMVGIELSSQEQRWAEVALYRALQAALRGQGESTRLMVCGFGSFSQWAPLACQAEPGKRGGLLHSVGEQQLESLIAHCGAVATARHDPDTPVPAEVMERLLKIPGFCQVWGRDTLASACFARHPVYLQAIGKSLRAYTRLLGFARQLNPPLLADVHSPDRTADVHNC
ncbi:hypothetical protein NJC40_05560 [Pseudomonas sp. 21LCFQ02]|uniref:transaldolase family protein n=1 Tax=Pseudomonas sp. 21LCFQ02 TaxID=2957505 RepID=UPI00209B6BB1|nr:transaldolase family protein [Pseudomonas sp. 21LCFQ02]MCO8167238.1 hypothetical protein [Pseudomonas sp. 21LCFQ02]